VTEAFEVVRLSFARCQEFIRGLEQRGDALYECQKHYLDRNPIDCIISVFEMGIEDV